MNKQFSVKFVADYIQSHGMIAYMITIGNQSRLCGCNPLYRGPYSSLQSVKRSYSYVKRVFEFL